MNLNITISDSDLRLSNDLHNANTLASNNPAATRLIAELLLRPLLNNGSKSINELYVAASAKNMQITESGVNNALIMLAKDNFGQGLMFSLKEGGANE